MTREDFIRYCNDNWDVEWYDMSKALGVMDVCRCPLRLVGDAGDFIIGRIRDLADDFISDNGLDKNWFDDNFEDEEELFWALDEKLFKQENYEKE